MKIVIASILLTALGLGSWSLASGDSSKAAPSACNATVTCTPDGHCLIEGTCPSGGSCSVELACDSNGTCQVVDSHCSPDCGSSCGSTCKSK
jgi:hypothetical protein